jgi:dynein heavy chain
VQCHFKELGQCVESQKVHKLIEVGMKNNAVVLQQYLTTWDNFKDIWEINKDAFIRRYHKLKPTVASFESDIARWDNGTMVEL